jgi:hypothetical protein
MTTHDGTAARMAADRGMPLVTRLRNAALLATPDRVRENLCNEASYAIETLTEANRELLAELAKIRGWIDDLIEGAALDEAQERYDSVCATIAKAREIRP